MSTVYKDTLTLFEELVEKGVPEAQAKIQAHQLGALGDHFVISLENSNARFDKAVENMDVRLKKIDSDLFWMRVIGAAMSFSFLSAWFR